MKMRLLLFLAVLSILPGGRPTVSGKDLTYGHAGAQGQVAISQVAISRVEMNRVAMSRIVMSQVAISRVETNSVVISGVATNRIALSEISMVQVGQGHSCPLPGAASFRHSTSSNGTAREEKRHGKSLISPAIVADHSVPPPQFLYCVRHFSIYLPGGCAQRPAGASFLRGPPFAAESSAISC